MLDRKTFRCRRCGDCCRKLLVFVDEDDIKKIESLCYKREEFVEPDYDAQKQSKQLLVKRIDNKCIFLRKDKDGYECQIYAHRPKVCRIYPFLSDRIESCKPTNIHILSKSI
jgi:Fe-S-cluster containining protein